MAKNNEIREEGLKLKIAQQFFSAFDCTDIIKRIDFAVKPKSSKASDDTDDEYLLWAEAKQQPTDPIQMLAQLILTIKADAYDHIPPKFIGCFDNEKISLIEYHYVLPIFQLNDFNWTQTPSAVDDKTVETVRNSIDANHIFTFHFDDDQTELRNFIKNNFNLQNANLLSTLIDKNNFIFVYQKWQKMVMPHIDADWDMLKKNYSIYDRDFFLAELNVDDNGTTDVSDDRTANNNFYITFKANDDKPYQLKRTDPMGLESRILFGFKKNGLNHYTDFWKRYKRPPENEYWSYIVERVDLLVPQDVRERKGAYFTPQIWVEKSQQYIADVLGENWQDVYYVWDCCAGTGNLLNGLTNKYNIWASTLDQQDVDVMRERIRNGANLLDSHVFQFDFLNDDFSKCPQGLQDIINDPEKRKKLVIYINPPYAEAGNKKQISDGGINKSGVSSDNKIYTKWHERIGTAARELFVEFLIRIYTELSGCCLGQFSTLKAYCAPNFSKFREVFMADLIKLFVVPANTFDNVKGKFPIGFFIWDTSKRRSSASMSIKADVYNSEGTLKNQHTYISYNNNELLLNWIRKYYDNEGERIAYVRVNGQDIQNNMGLFLTSSLTPNDLRAHFFFNVTKKNLLQMSIYLATRHCIEATWLNDRDQFLYPNNGWKTDMAFQTNSLIYTLFHGQNRISSAQGINHWIPFTDVYAVIL